MRFDHFRFEGFKSLRDVSLELDDVTVITGPNGAGKTNLAEALTFLAESLQYGLEIAVARAGGFANLAHHNESEGNTAVKCVKCEFVARLDLSEVLRAKRYMDPEADFRLTIFYYFSIIQPDLSDPSSFAIDSELFQLRDAEGVVFQALRIDGEPLKFRRAKRMKGPRNPLGSSLYPLAENGFIKFAKERADGTTLIIQALSFTSNIFNYLARELGQLKVFQLSPQLCRQPGISTPNALLSRHGDNLPAVVDSLKRSSPIIWSDIESAMRAVLPQLVAIDTSFTQDRRLSLSFKMEDSDRAWNANEMSDGTIQALALFVALFDWRSPVLVVEEPENALHPWILRHFLDLCRSATNKQIILTTHSPIVIDYTLPDNLRIMWNRGGQSHLAPVVELNTDVIELWKSGELRSFDIYDSGLIHEYLPAEYTPAEPVE